MNNCRFVFLKENVPRENVVNTVDVAIKWLMPFYLINLCCKRCHKEKLSGLVYTSVGPIVHLSRKLMYDWKTEV